MENHSENSAGPNVLVFAGSDATGGAGIQADIETLASMGCHCLPVITAITIQDTENVKGYYPLEQTMIVEQARAVLEDIPVHAIKIGMLGSLEALEAVHIIISDYSDIPLVFDPVLVAGGGGALSQSDMLDAMHQLILPRTTICTPNSLEARALAREADVLEACAHVLMDIGCEYVLITGTHEQTEKVVNTLYGNRRVMDEYSWERLSHNYHGSGCTLASAIAGLLAHGLDPMAAVFEAQEFTWQSLKSGYRLGMGQLIPNRFFWASHEEES